MYHYVRPIMNSTFPGIKGLEFYQFKNQIDSFYKQGYTFINLKTLSSFLKGNKLPNKSILLTFDDGYSDHYEYVYKLLKSKQIPGVFFPPVSIIKSNNVLDVNKIHFILSNPKNTNSIITYIKNFIYYYRSEFNLKTFDFYYSKLAVNSRFDGKKIIFIKRILQNELPLNLRFLLINELFKKFVTINEEILHSQLYLNIKQIKEMQTNNMDFGGHGLNHIWLGLSTIKEQENEIRESYKFLSNLLNNSCLSFAYPYGSYNMDTVKLLKKYNFDVGFTTIPKLVDFDIINSFKLPRMDTNDFPK